MKAKNIYITLISNILTICVCIFCLRQIEFHKTDWEKAQYLNLSD